MDLKEPPLPDTSKWQPRATSAETLQRAFLNRCVGVENFIRLRGQLERQMNIDNFDSGPGLEDIVREEFRRLWPKRYSVRCGVVNDRDGKTSGDNDLIVFNELWFPAVKAGATAESRRVHFPIEGVYAVGEIKQSLDFKTLDDAMEKLVSCHKLNRPRTFARRIVENRESTSCTHGLSNPLYSFILATQLGDGIELDRIVERFFEVNKSLKRLEVIRGLCVLGQGTVVWGFEDPQSGEVRPALFMLEDLYQPIFPTYHKVPKVESALYPLVTDILLHLFHSVLAAEDIAATYGLAQYTVSRPRSSEIVLDPDQDWIDSLQHFCKEDHSL